MLIKREISNFFTLLKILPKKSMRLCCYDAGEIKIDCAPPAVNCPIKISPATIDLHVYFINVSRAKNRKGYSSTSAFVSPFQTHNAEPSGKSWNDRRSLHARAASLAVHGSCAVFAVPANRRRDDITLKMATF